MIVQRGFKRPPSYHIERLRRAPIGYFFDVMTNGYGAMPDYSQQVQPADRWAIAAYIRALQLSQHATEADVPAGTQVANDAAAGRGHQCRLMTRRAAATAASTPPATGTAGGQREAHRSNEQRNFGVTASRRRGSRASRALAEPVAWSSAWSESSCASSAR